MTERRDAGLTLIEMLVVLAIVGITAGAAMLGIAGADRSRRAETEAVRLAREIDLAVDEALVTQAPLALLWDAHGYRFVAWDAKAAAWGPASGRLAEHHDLGTALSLERRDTALSAGRAAAVIAPGGTSDAATFEIRGSGTPWRIAFDGFGAEAVAGAT